ncbi:multidrug MFS transporter [Caldibacillus lycopersici]|uniref:Multidrug MFS transporter n=1 Tax=Perspicuibacillus lycopersici TaxID=1325689 RepID=A0AAE3IRD9_9BACI|nr:glycosyltransferase [Perspicuibacillus lycopersici]MCU9613193.1 multidrug MFS transporter [Perspicuibacillus lycopersici]
MIFVTVGTHEQQFNRLVKYIDKLKENETIEEDVIIQTGFSTYEPKHCKWSKLFPYSEMEKNIADARVVITHGGPSSFIMPLQVGKKPIVVPRKYEFKEHVNNHQVDFSKAVAERMGTIIVVEEIEKLGDTLLHYDEIVANMPSGLKSNNAKFNMVFEKIVKNLIGIK